MKTFISSIVLASLATLTTVTTASAQPTTSEPACDPCAPAQPTTSQPACDPCVQPQPIAANGPSLALAPSTEIGRAHV